MAFALDTIDPAALPSMPLSDREQLPALPCIYFAIDSQDTVQYIGRSVNLQQRWAGHHRCSQLEEIGGVRVAWLEGSDILLLPTVESALIAYFNPPLNRTACPHTSLGSERWNLITARTQKSSAP